jgi:glycerol-3-phosphate cytidylyltransferase-like family protein
MNKKVKVWIPGYYTTKTINDITLSEKKKNKYIKSLESRIKYLEDKSFYESIAKQEINWFCRDLLKSLNQDLNLFDEDIKIIEKQIHKELQKRGIKR